MRDRAQTLEVGRVDPLAAREPLRGGDRGAHVHAAAEHAIARAREHGAADLVVARDPLPRRGELAQRRRIERVRALGAIDRHERDVGMIGEQLEARGHAAQHSATMAAPRRAEAAMDFEWEPEHRAFLAELRAFIREWRTPELLAEYFATYGAGGPELSRFRAALEEKGWARMCWPVEQGGQGRNLLYQFLFVEEMEYWGMPYGNLTYTSIGPSIQHFGSEEQKRRWLPGIWSGEYTFAIGYSEPNAGTDLASLRTRAVRVGDEWVINGQKIWTSLADVATHIWLAVRTDPDLPKHQGISVFVVPTDVPGLTIRPLHAMYGGHTCETFYDDVRVPHANLVGGLNRGWGIVMHALNHERVGLAATGGLARLFDQLVAYLAEAQPEKLRDARRAAAARRARARPARAPRARAAQRVDHREGRHADRRGVDGEGLRHRAAHADRQHRDGPARPLRRALEGERRARACRGPHGVGVPDLADLPLRRRHQRSDARHHRGRRAGPAAMRAAMNLDLDPTQELLRDTVREFLRSEVPLDRIRELEREQRWDETLWKALCGQGWLGLPFAEAHGGGGGSLVDAGVLVEELARRAAIVPLVEAIACGVALERDGPRCGAPTRSSRAARGRRRARAGRARGERRLRAHLARARGRAPARREALRRLRAVRDPSPRRRAR